MLFYCCLKNNQYLTLSQPWLTVLTFGALKYVQLLRLYWFWCLSGNISLMIVGKMPWYILYISVARDLSFLLWKETELSIFSNCSKEDFLPLYIKRRLLSWSYLFCYYLRDYEISKRTMAIIKLRHEKRI